MLTVQDLINELMDVEDKSMPVVMMYLNQDKVHPVYGIEHLAFNERTHEYGLLSLTNDLIAAGYSEEDILKDGKPAIHVFC